MHRREYGHHFADSGIEIVNLRLVGAASAAKIAKPGRRHGQVARRGAGAHRAPAPSASTASSPTIPTDFYRRDLLPVGERIAGPAIVLQMDSTTVVPPQHNFERRGLIAEPAT